MKNLSYLILFLFGLSINSFSQVTTNDGDGPCGDGDRYFELMGFDQTRQSSTVYGGNSGIANDGVTSGNFSGGNSSLTHNEVTPFWEGEFNELVDMNDVNIHFPEEFYPNGFGDFYILMSQYPMASNNLEDNIASEFVNTIHVNTNMPNGSSISLMNTYGRFLRIQLAQNNSRQLGLVEVGVNGFLIGTGGGGDPEDCSNGIDDDCDGLVDCEDPDCGPVIFAVNGIDPTCPYCDDGQINVSVVYNSFPNTLLYSLDGGLNFEPFNPLSPTSAIHHFKGLNEGSYDIVVSNGTCESESRTIEILARRGNHGGCYNGGLEDGTTTNWSFASGFVQSDFDLIYQNFSYDPVVHNILPTEGNDPNFGPAIPLNDEILGEYVLRIVARNKEAVGIGQISAEFSLARYCFTVTEENADFFFSTALIFEEPEDGHTEAARPYHYWQIFDLNTIETIAYSGKIYANSNNDYFTNNIAAMPNDDEHVGWLEKVPIISGWGCNNVDLTEEIGNEVCIDFLVAGCALGGHGGYLYIDGLCTAREDLEPEVNLLSNEFYCSNQEVDIIASNSQNYDRYNWKIERFRDGQFLDQFLTEETTRFEGDPVFEDVLGWYFGDPHNPQTDLECDDQFKVSLVVSNQCELRNVFCIEFTYKCETLEVKYPDIYTCVLEEDFVIQGSAENQDGNCGSCNYIWSPSEYLYSDNVSNPTVIQGINYLAIDQTYTVTVTDPQSGCVEVDDVIITEVGQDPLPFDATAILAGYEPTSIWCDVKPVFQIDFSNSVDPSSITVDIIISNSHSEVNFAPIPYSTSLFSDNINGVSHQYILDEVIQRRGTYSFQVRIYNAFGELIPPDAYYNDACIIINEPNEDLMLSFEETSVFIPNALNPNLGVWNPTFNPIIDPVTLALDPIIDPITGLVGTASHGNTGIHFLRVLIMHANTAVVFDSGLWNATPDSPGFTGEEPQFAWDGIDPKSGLPYQPTTTFTYVVSYIGCGDPTNSDYSCLDQVDPFDFEEDGCNIWSCPGCQAYDFPTLLGNTGTFNIFY